MKKFKIEFKWAVIFVIASLLWMFLEKALGWHDVYIAKHPIYTSLFAILAIIIYVFALIDKRKNFYNGFMTWRQGFVAGLAISVIVAVFSPLTQYISLYIISPEFLENAKIHAIETGAMNRETANAYFSSNSYFTQAFFGAIGMGVVTSAAVAWFTKKDQ